MARGLPSPYISIVATSRNDDHGGNLLYRMQLFVNGLLAQCKRHDLAAELILVEWNPPQERPKLAEALQWPDDPGPCSVRIIEVPQEVHRRFKHSDRLPLFQMIGKNVGIRRARGRFMLATNIDILFSDELIRFWAGLRLRLGPMYRIDRRDVAAQVPLELPIEAQLEYCRNHVIRIAKRHGTLGLGPEYPSYIYNKFTLKRHIYEKIQDWRILPVTRVKRLHTNACGDFTLLPVEYWYFLRGYPELEMYSLHMDSLLCHAAHHSGFWEKVLQDPMRIYHIEHSTGSGWTPDGQQELYKRLDEAGIPRLSNAQFDAWTIKMRRERKPIMFNDENWGLAKDDLPESDIYTSIGPER